MDNTKTRICDAAMRLFNEKGYDAVSLREIAEEAGTTIGNLTYHFAQKDQLVEAIAQQYQDEFFPKIDPTVSKELENVVATFFRAQANEEKAPVYYRNISEFAKTSPSLAKRNEAFRKSLYDYYYAAFSTFKKNGTFRAGTSEEEVEILAYTIVFMASLWIQNTSPYYDKELPKIPLGIALCSTLRPHISETHLEKYADLCLSFSTSQNCS